MKSSVSKLDGWGRMGLFIHRFRFTVLVVLLLVAVLLGSFAAKLPSILGGDGFKTPGDYQRTQKILEQDFKQSQHTMFLVFQKKKGASQEVFRKNVGDVVKQIEKHEQYTVFRHPLNEPAMIKADIAYATILLKGKNEDEITKNTLAFAKQIQKESNSIVKVSPTGYTVINDEINKRSQSDLKKAEMIGVPIAFLVLLVSFGSLMASVLPIINGALSVITTMGILYFIGQDKELSVFVLNVAPMIGLALSIDFALLFVNRFREELQTKDVKAAMAATYQTAGRAIVFSGLCVFVGLSGLFFFEIDYIQSVAISGMIVVVMSMLFSLTLMPSFLSLMGKRLLKKGMKHHAVTNTFWRSFANFVMKYPVMMTMVVLAFIFVCLLPLRDANLQFPSVEALPEKSDARISYERYEQEFNQKVKMYADVTIVVTTPEKMTEKKSLQTVERIVTKLEQDKKVYEVTSLYQQLNNMPSEQLYNLLQSSQKPQVQPIFDAYTQGNKTFLQVWLNEKPKSSGAKEWVRSFKETYKVEGVVYSVGGYTKFEQELQDEIKSKIGIGASVILGSTFLILMIAFRSLLIPLKAIVMNILSLSATIGIIIWLFQGGHFGLEQSAVMYVLPIFVFGLVFGLSMDYEVFLISRMHEIYNETKDNDYSTLEGLVSTSSIITSAALIMIVVTGAFTFTDILPVKQMGLGVALAILLDATVIRLLLVPSLMKMFGHWNWWLPFRKSSDEEDREEAQSGA
ncbi:MMPL family transporter [Bacillus sp. 165]|uniref:MMPL family transporter n=1 Tax=Bacillus sp. 165 TaxID=1529117 RepID=UPI001ADB3066|nr:MMPL family transporter [Bacillus sp. 165]MBO9128484.1 MMPL family transporter [Bacillus sp. 165]